ncbi:MAG: hypothetical protein U9R19_09800 [Bacteroidota bacterium]|nr:hypothetical protein [Bacteroidota bacterium]
MKIQNSITDTLKKLLDDKSKNLSNNKTSNLSNVFEILAKHGLLSKSEYTLPLTDTIGKAYFDRIQFTD